MLNPSWGNVDSGMGNQCWGRLFHQVFDVAGRNMQPIELVGSNVAGRDIQYMLGTAVPLGTKVPCTEL